LGEEARRRFSIREGALKDRIEKKELRLGNIYIQTNVVGGPQGESTGRKVDPGNCKGQTLEKEILKQLLQRLPRRRGGSSKKGNDLQPQKQSATTVFKVEKDITFGQLPCLIRPRSVRGTEKDLPRSPKYETLLKAGEKSKEYSDESVRKEGNLKDPLEAKTS